MSNSIEIDPKNDVEFCLTKSNSVEFCLTREFCRKILSKWRKIVSNSVEMAKFV